MIETWQADPDGYFNHPDDPREKATDFRGFGRCPTADDGTYQIVTRRPGPVPAADGAPQAPHIDVSVFARGLLNRLVTRIYFPDDPLFPHDPIMHSVRDAKARTRMTARFDLDATEESYALGFEWDIVLRGREATPMENQS